MAEHPTHIHSTRHFAITTNRDTHTHLYPRPRTYPHAVSVFTPHWQSRPLHHCLCHPTPTPTPPTIPCLASCPHPVSRGRPRYTQSLSDLVCKPSLLEVVLEAMADVWRSGPHVVTVLLGQFASTSAPKPVRVCFWGVKGGGSSSVLAVGDGCSCVSPRSVNTSSYLLPPPPLPTPHTHNDKRYATARGQGPPSKDWMIG